MAMYALAVIYAGIAEINLKDLVQTKKIICDLGNPDSARSEEYRPAFLSPYTLVIDFLAHSGCLNIKEAIQCLDTNLCTDEDLFKLHFLTLPCVNTHVIHMIATCMHVHQSNMRFGNRCRRKTAVEIREHKENMWHATRNLILAFDPSLITDKGRDSFNICPGKK
jgi:hypothetical protein